jgi:tetratricopeptide (TPR) repeat protein
MTCPQRFAAALFALAFVGLAPLAAQAQTPAPTDALSRRPEVQAAYDEGMKLLGDKKYTEALAKFNEALRVDGSFAEAYIAKGDALKAIEAYQEAGTAYSRALEIDVNSAAAYNGRGECYMEMTPPVYDMAVNDFTNALNLDRSNAAALSNMGHVLVTTGQDPTNSILRLDEALAANPNDARALRDRGMAHAQLAEYEKATVDLKKAVEANPDDYETYQTLAMVHQIQEQYADAVDAYTKAIETYKPKHKTSPDSFNSGYISRADARIDLAEHETDPATRNAALEGAILDANAVLDAYPDRYPDSGLALFRRGRAERMLERYSKAVDTFQKALQAIPNGQEVQYAAEAYLYRGICFYYIGSLDLARGDFEQASSTGSGFGDPRIYLWLGYTYHKQDNYRRAIDYYNQAIAKAPNFSLAHINKGRAYMDLHEYNKAVESFNNAIRSEPEIGEHYYNVGVAYLALGKFETASQFLDIALRKDNPTPKMYHEMARALRGLKRNELATEYDRKGDALETKKAN